MTRSTGAASMVGRTVVVTGANAGLGFWTTLRLAERGARVVMACRSAERADAAATVIRRRVPDAQLPFVQADTSDLTASARAGDEIAASERVDVLIANAGIIHVPAARHTSVDGLELVAATNVFGHAALIARVLPQLRGADHGRIVTLGSLAALWPRLPLDDPQSTRRYWGPRVYALSKLMLQAYGFELDRRLAASGSTVRSVAAHPGFAISGRTPRVPGVNEPTRAKRFRDSLQAPVAQGKHRGAEPVVLAASDPHPLPGCAFYGPAGRLKGPAARVAPIRAAADPATGRTVWDVVARAAGTAPDLPDLPSAE